MYQLLATITISFFILLTVELLQKKRLIRLETTRKTIHVVHGLSVAVWPFFVDWSVIIAVEVLFIFAVAGAKKFKLFESQNGISRLSWGEFFYPIGVITTILLEPHLWIFITAILHLTLADAIAALVGSSDKSRRHKYLVFGQVKTVEGSLAFYVTSSLITAGALLIAQPAIAGSYAYIMVFLPLATTLFENIGVFGSDNFLVPVSVAVLLSLV